MKKMKKILSLMLAVCIALSGAVVSSKSAEAKSAGYTFKNKGVTIGIDSAAKKFIKKAGKPIKKQVKKSCAYKGKDRAYKYKNFLLQTYSRTNSGPEFVLQIKFLNKKAKTAEGVSIGSTAETVLSKYGKGYSETDYLINKKYVYKKGNCTLTFKMKNNIVAGITYTQTKVK